MIKSFESKSDTDRKSILCPDVHLILDGVFLVCPTIQVTVAEAIHVELIELKSGAEDSVY